MTVLENEAELRRRLEGCLQVIKEASAVTVGAKHAIRRIHSAQRADLLAQNSRFIADHKHELISSLANGASLDAGRIKPVLTEVGASTVYARLFRLASLTWSVPVSKGFGRRIRFLIHDDQNGKLIGLLALCDPVFNLGVRDDHIGWTGGCRRRRLRYIMDAFVLGALPPYNMLLGGKLVASLLMSKELSETIRQKYRGKVSKISNRAHDGKLAMVTTTSSLGRSSVYNRLVLGNMPILRSVGYTKGYGHFQVPPDLFEAIRDFLRSNGHSYADDYEFGGGPNWKLRTIRKCMELFGMGNDILLHGIKREVFVGALATNARAFLAGTEKALILPDLLSASELGRRAVERWCLPRSLRHNEYKAWRAKDVTRWLQ